MVVDEEIAKKAYILMHPLRHRIAKLIAKAENGKMYVNQIARELDKDNPEKYRRLVSHHMLVFAQHELVTSEYGPRGGAPKDELRRPVYVSYFELTQEAKDILGKIAI